MEELIPMFVFWAVILVVSAFTILMSLIEVEQGKYLIITREFPLLSPLEHGHFIALPFHRGIRAKVYTGAGWHFIIFVHLWTKTEQRPLFDVPINYAVMIEALDGEPLRPGQIVADPVECNNFLDGDAFLANGGQKGPQLVLPTSGKYALNEELFKPTLVPIRTIEVKEKKDVIISTTGEKADIEVPQVGIVTLNIGEEMPEREERVLARRVDGHNNFQELSDFVKPSVEKKIQKGIQSDVLELGSYIHHPIAVSVKVVEVEYIKEGEVGVIISSVGRKPVGDEVKTVRINGKTGFILTKEFGGDGEQLRGILPNVINPGFVPLKYANSIAYKIIRVQTTPIAIDWATEDNSKRHQHASAMVVRHDPIRTTTKDYFTPPFEAELIVSTPRELADESAPKIVAVSGGLKGLVNDLLVPIFDDIARTTISTKFNLEDFVERRDEVRDVIQKEIKRVIEGEPDATGNYPETPQYMLKINSFRISEIDFEHAEANVKAFVDFKEAQATATQEAKLFEQRLKIQTARIEYEKIKAQADNQSVLVVAEFQKIAAEFQRFTIEQRGEVLGGLSAIQALVADPNAGPALIKGLADFLTNLTSTFMQPKQITNGSN